MHFKDPKTAAILGFFFGGFGLFYVSIQHGLTAIGALFIISLVTGGLFTVPAWIGCAIWGWMAASKYNREHGLFPQIPQRPQYPQGPHNPYAGYDGSASSRPSCRNCGAPARPTDRFCSSCGAPP